MPIRTEIQLEAEAAAGISSNELVAGGTLVVLVEVSPSGNYGATSLLRPDNRQQLPQNFLSATNHRHKDIILCANISTQPTQSQGTKINLFEEENSPVEQFATSSNPGVTAILPVTVLLLVLVIVIFASDSYSGHTSSIVSPEKECVRLRQCSLALKANWLWSLTRSTAGRWTGSRENSCLQLWISPTSGGAPTPTLASTQASYSTLYNNFLHFALPLRGETRLKIRPKMRYRKLKIVQIMQNCKTGQVDQTDQGDWGDQSFMTMAHV